MFDSVCTLSAGERATAHRSRLSTSRLLSLSAADLKFYVVSFSNFSYKQRFHFLVRGAHRLRASPGYRLIIVENK